MTKCFDNLYTAAVAEYLGFANNTLRNWVARRERPMQRNRVSGYRWFKSSDLDKLLEKLAKPIVLK